MHNPSLSQFEAEYVSRQIDIDSAHGTSRWPDFYSALGIGVLMGRSRISQGSHFWTEHSPMWAC